MAKSEVKRELGEIAWRNPERFEPASYICGYCGDKVASKEGYIGTRNISGQSWVFIRICSGCKGPTLFLHSGEYFPASVPGSPIGNLPADVEMLYTEARQSASAGAYTASVLACRKILMHIAVAEGANAGLSFLQYVEYLDNKNFVPPKGKGWVDYIRTKGNEANHEIKLMGTRDATALISFVEMLLRFIYEFPGMVPPQPNP